jgi:small subunit ribosomal protein S13
MPRILGVDVPKGKRVRIALAYLYGVGPCIAKKMLNDLKIDSEKPSQDLTDDDISRIIGYLQKNDIRVEGELRREVNQNIRRLIDIGSYKGSRHKKGLPVHGQRTKCNARTRKGPRPRVGGVKPGKPGKSGK